MKHRKANKSPIAKVKTAKVKSMARRRRIGRRLRRYRPRFRGIRHKPKIPLEVALVGAAIPFTPAHAGWESPLQLAQRGAFTELGYSITGGFLGMNPEGNVDWWGLINPLNMDAGRYTKMLIAGALVSKVRKRLVKIPFDKVPFVGKYIS